MPTIVNKTGNPDIDALLWGYKWDFTNWTIRFPDTISEYAGYAGATGFTPFTEVQKQQIINGISNILAFLPVSFTYANNPGGGNFRFSQATTVDYNNGRGPQIPGGTNQSAEGNPPDPTFVPNYAQGDMWFSKEKYTTPVIGNFQYAAGLLHEFGHALGLKHGHTAQESHGVTFPALPVGHDSQEYSIMTYRIYDGQDLNKFPSGEVNYPWTYMQDDIAALQYMYGANYMANATNTTYKFSSTIGELTISDPSGSFTFGPSANNKIFLTIWDGGGIDTYDFSNFSNNQIIDLNPGNWSTFSLAQLASLGDGKFARGNVANALLFNNDPRSLIENANGGSGDDAMVGNIAANTLNGGAGKDTMIGFGGNDSLLGGDGDDFLNGGLGGDVLDGGPGVDTASYADKTQAVVTFLNGATNAAVTVGGVNEDVLRNVEKVIGGAGGDTLVGDSLNNTLTGGGGNDFLFSQGFNPDGTMKAGAGTNTLDGGDGDDGLFGGDGIDTLNGGAGKDGIVGGGGNDIINGDAGDDFLFGGAFTPAGAPAANSGDDQIFGGDGKDAMYGFDGADVIAGAAGDDYIEGGAGGDGINGGDGNDIILGGDGSDSITGGGGFDYIYGGAGGELFIFRKGDSADWILDFKASEGDRVQFAGFGYASFAAVPLVDLSTPGHPAVQLTFTSATGTDQLTIFGATLAQLNATNVLVGA